MIMLCTRYSARYVLRTQYNVAPPSTYDANEIILFIAGVKVPRLSVFHVSRGGGWDERWRRRVGGAAETKKTTHWEWRDD